MYFYNLDYTHKDITAEDMFNMALQTHLGAMNLAIVHMLAIAYDLSTSEKIAELTRIRAQYDALRASLPSLADYQADLDDWIAIRRNEAVAIDAWHNAQ